MSEDVEQQSPPEKAVALPPPTPTPPRAGVSKLALLALLLIAALAYGGYLLWQMGVSRDARISQLQADLAAAQSQTSEFLSSEVNDLRARIEEQNSKVAEAEEAVHYLSQASQSQERRILDLVRSDRSDWLLAEAEYLLRLANQRLLTGGEVRGARALLTAADNILVELDHVGLFPSRRAIASDIAALRAADKLDLEGVYTKIGALSDRIAEFSYVLPPQWQPDTSAEPAQDSDTEQPSGWNSGLKAAFAEFSNLWRIQHNQAPPEPLLSPDQRLYLQQNLRLMLEQAQLALLAGEATVYRQSLAKSQTWLEAYFDSDDAEVRAALATVRELARVDVSRNWPDISGSLKALQNYIAKRHGLPAREGAQSTDSGED